MLPDSAQMREGLSPLYGTRVLRRAHRPSHSRERLPPRAVVVHAFRRFPPAILPARAARIARSTERTAFSRSMQPDRGRGLRRHVPDILSLRPRGPHRCARSQSLPARMPTARTTTIEQRARQRDLISVRAADPMLISARRSGRRPHLHAAQWLARTHAFSHAAGHRVALWRAGTTADHLLRHRRPCARARPEIYLGRRVHEFLRCLDVPITRGERGSLRVYANQLLRLIHCAISIDENIRDAHGRTAGLHIRQALFAEEAQTVVGRGKVG